MEILKFYMFSPFEGIKKFDSPSTIIYRKSHERNALLLEKYLLENDISIYSDFVRIMTSSILSQQQKDAELADLTLKENAYIVGTLLEYAEENIEYLYQTVAFDKEHTNDTEPDEKTDVQTEAKKVKTWATANTNKWNPEFDNDKNAHKIWISLNKDIQNATLRKQNAALSNTIQALSYSMR